MRWMAALSLAGLLALGGCPGGQTEIPSAVTILAAGTYNGTLTCSWTEVGPAGESTTEQESPMTVEVTDIGQLYLSGVPYYQGIVFEDSDAEQGITSTLTINSITENADTGTVVIVGAGTTSNPQFTYQTARNITLVQTQSTEMEITDVYSGEDDTAGRSFELNCTGTVSR